MCYISSFVMCNRSSTRIPHLENAGTVGIVLRMFSLGTRLLWVATFKSPVTSPQRKKPAVPISMRLTAPQGEATHFALASLSCLCRISKHVFSVVQTVGWSLYGLRHPGYRFLLCNCSLTINYHHIIQCCVVTESVVEIWVGISNCAIAFVYSN